MSRSVVLAIGWLALSGGLVGCASAPDGRTAAGGSMSALNTSTEVDGASPSADWSDERGEDERGEDERGESESTALESDSLETDVQDPRHQDPHRRAMERALTWAREGVDLARSERPSEALQALEDARIALFEANLPEALQERGLALLDGSLGTGYEGVALEALHDQLERDLEPVEPEIQERRLVEKEARRILAKFDATEPDPEYLETFVDQVVLYIDYFRGRQRQFFERAYMRKHKYWPTLRAILTAKGIPEEQAYMALVESGFNPRARSHANAKGLWQFIPSTGRQYGLRREADFHDVRQSTEAASEYILDLISIFGSRSFLLAMASYNAGEGRIMRCLRDLDDPFGQRSYWSIRDCLPQETRDYVPRILAAAIIGSNPKHFGFDLPTADEVARAFDVVTIPEPTPLATLARQAGVTVAAIRTANTDLSSRATSTPVRNFPLYLPKGGGGEVIADLAATSPEIVLDTELPLSVQVGSEPRPTPSEPTTTARRRSAPGDPPVQIVEVDGELTIDRVDEEPVAESPTPTPTRTADRRPIEVVAQRGDTLGKIAQSHGVTVADLKRWNPVLRSRVLYRGDRLTVYSDEPAAVTTYRVRRGDTLSTIAQRHGVTVRDLMATNDLRSAHRIQPGQLLEIGPGTSPGARSRPRTLVFTVQPGNSLQTIARLFEVRYRDIMRWNGLRSSRLRVGQRLEIHPSRPFEKLTHRVRRGDTVGKIARQYGVSTASIFTANGMQRYEAIRPGQRLELYR